jgi:hypothetical protein
MSRYMSAGIPKTGQAQQPEWKRWGSPVMVVALWLTATLLHILEQFRFPEAASGSLYVSPILFLSSVPLVAALVASALVPLHRRTLPLAASLLVVDCAASVVWLVGQAVYGESPVGPEAVGWFVALSAAIASGEVVARSIPFESETKGRRALAVIATMLIVAATPLVFKLDSDFALLAQQYWPVSRDGDDVPPDIDAEKLWTMQPTLVDRALAATQCSSASPKAYVLTIGAGGSQQIFGREARAARDVLGHAFTAQTRSVILANDEKSLYQIPLAANSNLEPILVGLGRKMDRSRDLAVIYLTSHGSEKAELMTDLPDYEDLQPIGAVRLATELAAAGIKRRVIIVSACHAGSWIKPLASDDTIVIAAARADRSSFGCSDDRELTYFGEAFLKGPLAKGASLADSFKAARRTVAEWEGSVGRHSEPQAFVGKNMAAVWKASTANASSARN